jgi:hypothetical protein
VAASAWMLTCRGESGICTEARLADLVDRCFLRPYRRLLIVKIVRPAWVKGTDKKVWQLSVMRAVADAALSFVLVRSVKA